MFAKRACKRRQRPEVGGKKKTSLGFALPSFEAGRSLAVFN